MDGPDGGRIQPTKGFIKQEEENTPELTKRKMKVQQEEKDGRTAGSAKKPQKPAESRKAAALDLSKTDLLHLLGIMEGEVQVRIRFTSQKSSDKLTVQYQHNIKQQNDTSY